MAAPEAMHTVYDETEMTVDHEDAAVPRCLQLMFDGFLHFFKYFIDPSLPQLVEPEPEVDQQQEPQLSLKDIETIDELNAELDKMTDEAKQCITELEWYIQKYPEHVVLKELEPVMTEVKELLEAREAEGMVVSDPVQDQQ